VQTNEVRYIYDGMLVIQERDANNLPIASYTRGKDLSGSLQGAGGIRGLLARSDNSQTDVGLTSAHAYFHADGNGNVTCLISTNQIVVAKYLYDSFGNTLSKSGPLAEANTYRFSSKEWHENSGLYYYGYRFYDPNLQRWLNRDPIGIRGGINLYRFIGNNAVNWIDLFGLLMPDRFEEIDRLNWEDAMRDALSGLVARCWQFHALANGKPSVWSGIQTNDLRTVGRLGTSLGINPYIDDWEHTWDSWWNGVVYGALVLFSSGDDWMAIYTQGEAMRQWLLIHYLQEHEPPKPPGFH
jgi:RHS repeat-associated protein